MRYVIDLDDTAEPGITAAREARNSSLPATVTVPSAIEDEPATDVPNPDLLATNADYVAFVLSSAAKSWCQQHAAVPTPPPEIPEVEGTAVPQSISPGQGELQLLREGLLDAVTTALASPDTPAEIRIAFARATEWRRDSTSVIAMMSMLGKTDADADAFFTAAAQIKL